jgi:Spy/CpxP family protein refolding chaperone
MKIAMTVLLICLVSVGHAEPPSRTATAVDRKASAAREFRGEQRGRIGAEQRSYGDLILNHVNELKLSDDQVGKITRIQQDTRKKLEEVGGRVRDTRRETHQGFVSPSVDEAAVRRAAEAHGSAFMELVDTALKARTAINAVLNAEQLQKLKALRN